MREERRRRSRKALWRRGGVHMALILYSAFSLVPLLFTVFASLRSESAFFGSPFSLAGGVSLNNYGDAWAQANLPVAFVNSLVVTLVGVLSSTIVGGLGRLRRGPATAVARLVAPGAVRLWHGCAGARHRHSGLCPHA